MPLEGILKDAQLHYLVCFVFFVVKFIGLAPAYMRLRPSRSPAA